MIETNYTFSLAKAVAFLTVFVLLLLSSGCAVKTALQQVPEPVFVKTDKGAPEGLEGVRELYNSAILQFYDGNGDEAEELLMQARKQSEGLGSHFDVLAVRDEIDSFQLQLKNYRVLVNNELPEIARLVEEYSKSTAAMPEFDFPVEMNSKVESYINLYSGKRKKTTEKVLSRGSKYIPMMKEIFRKHGLPEDLVYVPFIESAFKVDVVSRAGARGLWQFMPATGRKFNLHIDWWVDERVDPVKATEAAASYLKVLYNMFGDWNIALASYNAGEGKLQRTIRKTGTKDFWKIAQTRYLRRETRNYVPSAHAAIMVGKYPERYGLNVKNDEPFEYDEVIIPSATELGIIAKCSGSGLSEIKELNPALKRIVTPDRKNYELKIPKGTKEHFLAAYSRIPADRRVTWKKHRVRKGETLSRIASLYKTDVNSICKFNSIRNRNRISVGQSLMIPLLPNMSPDMIPATTYKTGETVRYTVKKGDSLYKIARKFNTDTKTISTLNNIGEKSTIHPGDVLSISYGRVSAAEPESTSSKVIAYLVKQGDTLYQIARVYNTTVKALRLWNDISRHEHIFPGDKITIYKK